MKLQLISENIFIAKTAIDFRKGIPTLCALVVESFSESPQSGVFIFYNKERTKLKLLGWHGNGFVLLQKVLEKGKFYISMKDQTVFQMTEQQLSWLLAGLDWRLMSCMDSYQFEHFS